MPNYSKTINLEGHSGIHSEEYERIVFTRGNYAAVEIKGDYNVIIINAGCRFDGRFIISGSYNKITVHNDVNFNNGIIIGNDSDPTVGQGNHVKCLGKTHITRDINQYSDSRNYALQINGHYTHWEGSGMNTKVVLMGVSGKHADPCVVGRKRSDGNALSSPTKWCIIEKTNFMALVGGGGSGGSSKYVLYVNGSTQNNVACGHLITNNWFGSLLGYDSSVSAGQDSTSSGGQVVLVGGTTRFVENHIEPVYTGGINLNLAGRRNIVLFNHIAHGGSYAVDMSPADNCIVAGNLIYWNDAKSSSTHTIRVDSGVDRTVVAGNRIGNVSSITGSGTNNTIANNEGGSL